MYRVGGGAEGVLVPPRCTAVEACTPAHISPPTTASARGWFPTANVRTTASVAGSIRTTPPPYWLATHTPPGPTAIASGPLPTGMVAETWIVWGSIRDTVPSRRLASHTKR
jgi:hypothetical protein